MGDCAPHADKDVDKVLRLEMVRSQAHRVLEIARHGHLNHFDFDEGRMSEVAEFVMGTIAVSAAMFACLVAESVAAWIRSGYVPRNPTSWAMATVQHRWH